VTCHAFAGRASSRPGLGRRHGRTRGGQVAQDQSGDQSPHSKKCARFWKSACCVTKSAAVITRQPRHRRFRLNTAMKSFSTRLIRVVLALTVAFWMAGAGCLLGCESMVAAATNVPTGAAYSATLVASGEVCASKRGHDCCAKGGKRAHNAHAESNNLQTATDVLTTNLSGTSTSMIDCPLAMNASAALSRAKQDQSRSVLLLTDANPSTPSLQEQVTALSSPTRLPNRGHTYLRCCVFLI
jgi:hypothetical protein